MSDIRAGKRLCPREDKLPFIGGVWDYPPRTYENRMCLMLCRLLAAKANHIFDREAPQLPRSVKELERDQTVPLDRGLDRYFRMFASYRVWAQLFFCGLALSGFVSLFANIK